MNRRTLLKAAAAAGGLLLIGKTQTIQTPAPMSVAAEFEITPDGNIVIPGFFTVFVDGDEAFRMHVGDTITAERSCRIVAFKGLESRPCHNFYMHEGDSLTIT